ncbi:LuxR C-terminal-related transcriptional regulator [Streptomyces violaceusniger]|uniref:helix-turn-helix transcriptional regulator n=1 Tax=Streptomyces violaceusniger TaxID=68280 RepID=UPI0036B3C7AE
MSTGYTNLEADKTTNDESRLMVVLYAYAAARDSVSRNELLQLADTAPDEAGQAIDRLLQLKVLTSKPGDPDRLIPVAPATAYTQLLLPAIRELRERQMMINEVSAELVDLLPVYEKSVMEGVKEHLLHRLDNVDAVRLTLSELSARATREILISQPGDPRPEPVLKEATDRAVGVLESGVRMRTLYQYAAQFHQPTVDHVSLLVEKGAEVRVVTHVFMQLIVFDREVALVELVGNPKGALLIRDLSVIHFLVGAFERAWGKALPFPLTYERNQMLFSSEEMKTAIVELLVEGYDDKVVAKRLGISLRTFQRHLAEVLRRIGARNRLHAGYLLRDLGILQEKSARQQNRRVAG